MWFIPIISASAVTIHRFKIQSSLQVDNKLNKLTASKVCGTLMCFFNTTSLSKIKKNKWIQTLKYKSREGYQVRFLAPMHIIVEKQNILTCFHNKRKLNRMLFRKIKGKKRAQ